MHDNVISSKYPIRIISILSSLSKGKGALEEVPDWLQMIGEKVKWQYNPQKNLTLFAPAYLSVSKNRWNLFAPPPHVFRVWFGLGFQVFLEITSPGMIYQIEKDWWSLDA